MLFLWISRYVYFSSLSGNTVNTFQMPLVDGIDSTRMIRAFENEVDGALNATRHHVPIIAVSASLVEEERFKYVQHGYVICLRILDAPAHFFIASMLGS